MRLSGFCGIYPLVLEDDRILLGLGNEPENIAGIILKVLIHFGSDGGIEGVAPMVEPGLHRIFKFYHSSRSVNAHLALNAHYVH